MCEAPHVPEPVPGKWRWEVGVTEHQARIASADAVMFTDAIAA
jgi:hypothetical protein